MTDIVTRLLALADENFGPGWADIGPYRDALREAAEVLTWVREESDNRAKIIVDLKAKLNGACLVGDDELAGDYVQVTRERDEARAEAAALRDVVLRTPHASWCAIHEGDECNCPRRQLIEALSQPGPGAAYQAYVRKLEAIADKAEWWTEHKENCVRYHTMPMAGCDCGAQAVLDALAALKESP